MKNITKKTITVLFILFASSIVWAGNGSLDLLKQKSENAYYLFEKSKFMEVIGLTERILSNDPTNENALYYSALSKYRLVNMALSQNDNSLFNAYYNSVIEETNKLMEYKNYSSEAEVLQAATIMMNLAIEQNNAPTLAVKIHNLLRKAETNNPENPRLYLVKGIMTLNTPPQFGGSVSKALELFQLAEKKFEQEPASAKVTWGKYENSAWEGIAYQREGKKDSAKKVFQDILIEKPNFKWVKHSLLPSLEQKENKIDKSNSSSTTLKIEFDGFDSNAGFLKVALSNSEENYEKGEYIKTAKVKIDQEKAIVIFNNLPYGTYAASCYHDENKNDKLDTGMFGIPEEAYGFSNNARGTFGPAEFEDASFKLDTPNKTIKITLE